MRSEIILYGYLFVCLSMLVFNVIYNIVFERKNKRIERVSEDFSASVARQMEEIRCGGEIEAQHLEYLWRRLSHVNQLIAFEHAVVGYMEKADDAAVEEYCRSIFPVMVRLAKVYVRRENMQAAYFVYFLSELRIGQDMDLAELQEIIVGYIQKNSLYCRVNALRALYEFGSEENIVRAVTMLDLTNGLPHEKILTDGLLTFTGDHAKLIGLFLERLDGFSDKIQLALVNYIRYKSGDYKEEMFEIMTDGERDKELRISAIRYFGSYAYEPAREPLMAFASEEDTVNWEYAAIAVSSLAKYEGEDVIGILIEATRSSNWYVRLNAATALEAHHLDYGELIEIFDGHDRYAREMMMYRLDLKRVQNGAKEAVR